MTGAVPPQALLECDALSKVFCSGFEQGRRYAFSDMLRLGARPVDRLRADEWLAVRSFSVRLHAGENVVVLGMSGAGKTTIAKLLTGMLLADGGRVRFHGRVGLVAGGKLGMVPFLTVWEFVQIATGIHGAEPDVADACCEEVLEITGLADERDTKIVDVEKNRLRHLALVSAMVVPQDVRIFDGLPRAGADPVGRRVAARAGTLLEHGSNLIFSATTSGLPSNVAHAMILHDGEVVYEGGAETVIPVYDHFVYRFQRLGHADAQAKGGPPADETAPTRSPAELITRAVQGVERSKIGSVVEDRVAQAWRSNQPIIIGPYLSDVGFELLYWRPFIAWMHEEFGPRSAPVVSVSRGRVADWYAGLSSDYIDVCDLVPFDLFQRRNRERIRETGSWKQKVVSDFDRELLDRVAERLGAPGQEVLHPSLIFRVCSRIWNGSFPHSWLVEHGRYQRFAAPPVAPNTEPYVAASFWFSSCFSDTRAHRQLMHQALTELSRRLPVVVIDTGGFPGVPDSLDTGKGISVVPPPDHAADQLREQARVIAGAQAFIGTFGGTSLLAPFHSVPTLTVFDEEGGLFSHHRTASRLAAEAMADVRFDVVRTTELNPARLSAWIDQALS
jgi:ABC-type multidrug transport system ATPase subunit